MHKTLADDSDDDTYNCELLAEREISFGIMEGHDSGMILSILHSFTPLQSSIRFAKTKSEPVILYVATSSLLYISFIREAPSLLRTHAWHNDSKFLLSVFFILNSPDFRTPTT